MSKLNIGYEGIDSLKNYYLEDSYVMNIERYGSIVKLIVDLVLTENHPLYRSPKNDENYCYRRGEILFEDISCVDMNIKDIVPSIDLSGDYDFGNIDIFSILEDGRYYLEGSWGDMSLFAKKILVKLSDTD